MCLIVLAWDAHEHYDLVLAANRDEFLDRPAAPLQRWEDGLVAGRDLRAGGTWLGVHPGGRIAMLTNIRRPGAQRADAPSRGDIVPRWLRGDDDPASFCAALARASHNPFNLIAGDLARGALFWTASDHPAPRRLAPGLHGVSNAALDTPWPKLTKLKAAVAEALQRHADDKERLIAALLQALADRERVPDALLPATGVAPDVERGLSSVFIDMPGYGTRCSTVLLRERASARLTLVERSHGPGAQDSRIELARWPRQALPAGALADC